MITTAIIGSTAYLVQATDRRRVPLVINVNLLKLQDVFS